MEQLHTTKHPDSTLLTAEVAAAYLHVDRRTLANWRALGPGRSPRYARIGRQVLYRKADLDAFIDAHVFEQTAAEPNRRHSAMAVA